MPWNESSVVRRNVPIQKTRLNLVVNHEVAIIERKIACLKFKRTVMRTESLTYHRLSWRPVDADPAGKIPKGKAIEEIAGVL